MPFSEQIKKVKGGWKVKGEKKKYSSQKAAKKRARQHTFFKNLEKSSGGPGSLKAKIRKKKLAK